MSFKSEYTAFIDTECVGELAEKIEGAMKHGLAFARRTAPVDTGAYRKSVVYSVGKPAGGSSSVRVNKMNPFNKFYIYNDSPYARCIEYGCKGKVPWSHKAPNGVFEITAIAIRSHLSR